MTCALPIVPANDDAPPLFARLEVDEYVARVRLQNANDWLHRARITVRRLAGRSAEADTENAKIIDRAVKARDVATLEWEAACARLEEARHV